MKKREISRIDNPNDPFINTRPSNSQLNFPKSPLTKEIVHQKKVKFANSGKESPRTSCRLERDCSHMPSERENVTTCDAKTSEYAFFKKLKNDANLRFPSSSLKKDVTLSSKKPESGDCSKERTSDVGIGRKGNNSSRIIQDVSTFKTDSFLSPSGGAWNMSDLHSISSMPRNTHGCGGTLKPRDSFSHEGIMYIMWLKACNLLLILRLLTQLVQNNLLYGTSGNQYVQGDIFSTKRQKLRQYVADAVFPDMENLYSKGHDIVSMLLNRLLPMGRKNKYKDSDPGKVESATRYDLLDSRDSNVQFKEHYQIPKRKLIELESGSHFNDQLFSPTFLRSDERSTQHGQLSTYHSHDFQPPYNITAPKCKLSETPSFSASVTGDEILKSLSNKVANATGYSLHDSRELDVHFTGKVESATRYVLLDSRDSNVQFKERYQIPKRKLIELESGSHYDDQLFSPMLLESNERTTQHDEFSTYPSDNFQPPYSITVPKCKLSETPSFSASVTGDKVLETLSNNVANSTGYSLHDSQEFDVPFTEHHQIPKTKLLELESSSYFSDHLLSPMHLKPVELITSHADFPIYPHKFQPVFRTDAERKFDGISSFVDKNDVTHGFLCNEQKHETFTFNHFDGLGKLKREPIPLLLEKDFDCIKDETKLPMHLKSDHLLSPMHLKPVELITSHTDFPIFPHKFQPVFKTEAESKFDGIPSFVDKNDVTHGFLCNGQKHETFTFNHFEELGKLKREPIPLLLEEDFNCIKDETKLPITCQYAKPDRAASLSVLGHSEEQTLNNALGEYHFSPSSLLLDKPQDFNSVLDSGLLRYQEFQFGKYVYKDYEDIDMNFNHKALSLSNNKHYFKLSDNCKIDTSFVQDSMYLSPFQHWFRKVVSSDYHHHPHTDVWLPSSLDERQRCLISSPSNYQSSDSRTLQLPQTESMSSLFHIDKNYKTEIDGGNPREVLYHFSEDFIGMYNASFLHLSMQRGPFSLDDSDNITEREQTHEMLL